MESITSASTSASTSNFLVGAGGILLVVVLVYVLILSIVSTVTGSLYLSKIVNQPLKDSYNIVLYDDGSQPIAVRKYIIDTLPHTLTPDQVDMSFGRLPSIIFAGVQPSVANKIVIDLRKLGATVDAV